MNILSTTKQKTVSLSIWWNKEQSKCIIHEGKVGYQGKTKRISVKDEEEVNQLFEEFEIKALQAGYGIASQQAYFDIVIQFPLKSEMGSQRDHWLKDKVQEYLNDHLGWYGLGYVDGFDMGGKKLNIFCKTVMEDKAVSSIKTCLKNSRLDFTKALIASRAPESDEYYLKFSYKKKVEFKL